MERDDDFEEPNFPPELLIILGKTNRCLCRTNQ